MTDFVFENGSRHQMPLLSSEAAFFSEVLLKLTHNLLLKCLVCKIEHVSCYFREKIPHIRLAVDEDMTFFLLLLLLFNAGFTF